MKEKEGESVSLRLSSPLFSPSFCSVFLFSQLVLTRERFALSPIVWQEQNMFLIPNLSRCEVLII